MDDNPRNDDHEGQRQRFDIGNKLLKHLEIMQQNVGVEN